MKAYKSNEVLSILGKLLSSSTAIDMGAHVIHGCTFSHAQYQRMHSIVYCLDLGNMPTALDVNYATMFSIEHTVYPFPFLHPSL
jgi:hypothetical protein